MWINIPTCLSVPAAADSTSDSNLFWETFARSVGWSGKPSPSATWLKRWKRDVWLKRLCGRICEPSTAALGVESWIASLRVIHASRSASPASVVEKTILDTFGRTSLESLAKWNRQSCFSKTCPAILALASRRSPEIFKQWVTKLRRDSTQRRKSAQVTKGSDFSLWRSPTSQQPGVDADKLTTKDGKPVMTVDQRLYLNGLHRMVGLPQQTAIFHRTLWATPRAEERRQYNSRDSHAALSRQAPLWPTPNVPNGGRTVPEQQMLSGKSAGGRKIQKPLTRTAELWPTPRTITGGAESAKRKKELGRRNSGGGDLQAATQTWAMSKNSDCGPEPATETFSKNPYPLNEVTCRSSRPVPEKSNHGGKSSKSIRRLNPRFVAWLMGWPHIDSGFSATEWFLYRQRMRSALCGLVSNIKEPNDSCSKPSVLRKSRIALSEP